MGLDRMGKRTSSACPFLHGDIRSGGPVPANLPLAGNFNMFRQSMWMCQTFSFHPHFIASLGAVLRVLRTEYTIMALSPTPGAENEGFSRIKGLVLMSTYAYPVYQEGHCA